MRPKTNQGHEWLFEKKIKYIIIELIIMRIIARIICGKIIELDAQKINILCSYMIFLFSLYELENIGNKKKVFLCLNTYYESFSRNNNGK
jgi:hypothetical protein